MHFQTDKDAALFQSDLKISSLKSPTEYQQALDIVTMELKPDWGLFKKTILSPNF